LARPGDDACRGRLQHSGPVSIQALGLEDYLTWGAFTYPVSFLVTDLTNRRYGVGVARRLVAIGFVVAVVLSVALATPRIAFASGTAFLAGQLLDVTVFNSLRRHTWWRAPLIGSLLGSALDTALFFSLAFAGDMTATAVYPFGIVAPGSGLAGPSRISP
jgi:uncharacterized PurR-regulated membrane protein YhhQ (DUF165 family)